MARHSKGTTPAPVDLALGLVAALWFGLTQGAGWLRLLAAGVALGAAVLVGFSAIPAVRGAASTWAPNSPIVVAPCRVPAAAVEVARV